MGKKSKNKSKQNNKKKSELQQQQAQGRTGQDTTAAAAPSEIDAPEDPLFHLLSKENADLLADKLLAPHRHHGLEPHLQDKDALSSYLYDVFYVSASVADYFAERLINGLYDETGDSMMWRFKMNKEGDEFTLLAIVCQWKQFIRYSWKGKSEMVKIVLAHPKVSVNELMPNGCNAAFLAAKYADAKTMQYLIDAGCDLSQRDKYGKTLLSNAVEYPDPDVLRIVMKHVSPFETIPLTDPETGEVAHLTAVDHMLSFYDKPGPGPISWEILNGPSPIEKVAECFIMLRQCGVKVTNHPIMTHLKALAICFESVTEAKKRDIRYAKDFRKLGMCMIGLWFPPVVQNQIYAHDMSAEVDAAKQVSVLECFLCNENIHKKSKLYCGHIFCRDCIVEYGKTASKCPICHRQLCLDVSPNRDELTNMKNENYEEMHSNDGNLGRLWSERHISIMKGIKSLSYEQVKTEAQEFGIATENFTEDDLCLHFARLIEDGHFRYYKSGFEKSSLTITRSYKKDGPRVGEQVPAGAPILETTASVTFTMEESTAIAPNAGPIWVEIKVKGIPILASISNNSRYTIVSPKFREIFNLKKIPNLTTKKLKCMTSNMGRSICLEEFSFDFGGTEVKLRNAMECETFNDNIGIQLGQDFLLSGRYSVLSANISDDQSNPVFYVADGTCSWIASQKSESLRYYTYDGAIVKEPLVHFKPRFNNEQLLVMSIEPGCTLLECSYCCRTFPAWKRSKCCDDVYYCDDRCQKASRKIHQIRRPGCMI